jgi:branched-subunit amino acid aminotransferase/4-amino-4-deoxychorismate lyase
MTYRELSPYAESATLKTYPFPKNERSVLAGKKSISYGENAHALRWAKTAGCDDALFLTTLGLVSETAVANVMWQSRGSFFTPALSTGCLPGITREMVIESFGVTEVEARQSEVVDADALYLLSSTRLIQRVARYDEKNYEINPLGEKLVVDFSRWIAENMN